MLSRLRDSILLCWIWIGLLLVGAGHEVLCGHGVGAIGDRLGASEASEGGIHSCSGEAAHDDRSESASRDFAASEHQDSDDSRPDRPAPDEGEHHCALCGLSTDTPTDTTPRVAFVATPRGHTLAPARGLPAFRTLDTSAPRGPPTRTFLPHLEVLQPFG